MSSHRTGFRYRMASHARNKLRYVWVLLLGRVYNNIFPYKYTISVARCHFHCSHALLYGASRCPTPARAALDYPTKLHLVPHLVSRGRSTVAMQALGHTVCVQSRWLNNARGQEHAGRLRGG